MDQAEKKPMEPIKIRRAQFRALSPFAQAVAIVFLRRGTGEVVLVD